MWGNKSQERIGEVTPGRSFNISVFGPDVWLTLGQAQGVFERAGLDLHVTTTPNSTEQMRGLAEDCYNLAFTAFDNVLAWSGRAGAEIVAIAQAGGEVLLPVYARPETPTFEALRGHALAVDAVDTAFALVLRRILLHHGLDLRKGDYTVQAAGATASRFESLVRGDTVAAILNPPFDRQAEERGFIRLGDQREVLPSYPGTVLAASKEWAENERQLLSQFLSAWQEAGHWARVNAAEAIQILADRLSLSTAVAERRLTGSYVGGGPLQRDALETVLKLREDLGLPAGIGSDIGRYLAPEYL